MQFLFPNASVHNKEAYVLFGLMSYARQYWRKAVKRNTQGQVTSLIGKYDQLMNFCMFGVSRYHDILNLGCNRIAAHYVCQSSTCTTKLPKKIHWLHGWLLRIPIHRLDCGFSTFSMTQLRCTDLRHFSEAHYLSNGRPGGCCMLGDLGFHLYHWYHWSLSILPYCCFFFSLSIRP